MLSREKQVCAICNETFSKWDNLRRHFERNHPNDKVRVKGQQTISFGNTSQKRKFDDEDDTIITPGKPDETRPAIPTPSNNFYTLLP